MKWIGKRTHDTSGGNRLFSLHETTNSEPEYDFCHCIFHLDNVAKQKYFICKDDLAISSDQSQI